MAGDRVVLQQFGGGFVVAAAAAAAAAVLEHVGRSALCRHFTPQQGTCNTTVEAAFELIAKKCTGLYDHSFSRV